MDILSRVVVITGSNKGLGFTLARELLRRAQHTVVLAVRDQTRGNEALKLLKDEFPEAKVSLQLLDVTSDQSIRDFSENMKQSFKTIDVLVNNAAIVDKPGMSTTHAELFSANLVGVIKLTDTLLPQLSEDGKIVTVSSDLGKLSQQPEQIRKRLTNPNITLEEIIKESQDFTNSKGEEWQKDYVPSYKASKALLNAWERYILVKQLKSNQSSYILNPGWCRTEMGGDEAYYTAEEGIRTMTYLIDTIPFKNDPKINGQFYDHECKIMDF